VISTFIEIISHMIEHITNWMMGKFFCLLKSSRDHCDKQELFNYSAEYWGVWIEMIMIKNNLQSFVFKNGGFGEFFLFKEEDDEFLWNGFLWKFFASQKIGIFKLQAIAIMHMQRRTPW